ncbi:outer membrane lipoprotein-sorting protein [Burkholderia metallica]
MSKPVIVSLASALVGGLVLTAAGAAPVQPHQSEAAQDILAHADQVRNPEVAFRVSDQLVEYDHGVAKSAMFLHVYSKIEPKTEQFRNLVQYVRPTRDAGKILLQTGHAMWFYDPLSSASVRISPQQRLLGQASNADVLTLNFAKEFSATLVGEETIKDADQHERACWHLLLVAKDGEAIYQKADYWIDKAQTIAVKGRFYADSGRPLKVVYYRKYVNVLGGMRLAEAIILDEVDTNVITKMDFTEYIATEIPENWYQRGYLPYLRPDDAGSR